MSDLATALFLGFVEGLTEFIPVSSTAHLVVLTEGLNFPAPPGHVFEVFIQLGAILAVIVNYRRKLFNTVMGLRHDKKSQNFALNLLLGSIPAFIAGALGRDWIKESLYNHGVIAATLILGGFIILLLDKRLGKNTKISDVDDISPRTALLIGCCQALALVPGVSRSGATIMGALGCGLARPAAAEFSFFLAIPVMLAAVAYDTAKGWSDIVASNHFGIMMAGLVAAFITALAVIKFALLFISRHGFTPFAWYRIAAGIIVLMVFA